MDSPFFSIIIPTYNSDGFISKAIESLLFQTFSNYEVLIIDGDSKDNTLDIARNFNDRRITVFSEGDNGIYDAMNKGISHAKGSWLYFLGSDDFLWDKEVLADVARCINENEADFIYGNAFSPEYGENYDGPFTNEKLISKNICHQAIFYHKSIFKKKGLYNIDYKVCADYDFNLKCFFDKSIRKLHIPRLIAKFNAGGKSNLQKSDLFLQNRTKIMIQYGWNVLPERIIKKLYKNKSAYIKDRMKRLLLFPPPKKN